MPFHVKHPDADRLVRELMQRRGCGLTDAVRFALEQAVAAEKARATLPAIAAACAAELSEMARANAAPAGAREPGGA